MHTIDDTFTRVFDDTYRRVCDDAFQEMQKSEIKQIDCSISVEDGFDVSHGCILVHTHHQAYCRLGPYFLL
jgi:hypothetical protein